MAKVRRVSEVKPSRRTTEGAGVKLRRAFGDVDPRLDPFLLLDHFGSERPEDYLAGFPWHPHRGMETITYMIEGRGEHADSLGNTGEIGPGDVQWMTAGSGIVHQEMPQRSPRLEAFQLWSNLPRDSKMMPPRYQDIPADALPVARWSADAEARVICGRVDAVSGPVREIVTDPLYLDVTLRPGATLAHDLPATHNVFAYVFRGSARFGGGDGQQAPRHSLVIFEQADPERPRELDIVRALAGDAGARFLLVAGKPIGEPVAWGGPIVMNTEDELREAFRDYREGTFITGRT